MKHESKLIKLENNKQSERIIIACNRGLALTHCFLYFVFLALFIFSSTFLDKISKSSGMAVARTDLRIFFITFCVVGLFFSLSLSFVAWSIKQNQFSQFRNYFVLLSLISINFGLIVINTVFTLYQRKRNPKSRFLNYEYNFQKLGFYRWSIFDITLVAIFSALVVLGNWFEMNIHFLPYGSGGINIKYAFVMIIAYLHSLAAGLTVGVIGSLISILFLGGFIVSPWSYLLDYLLPTMSPCVVALFSLSLKEENKKLIHLNYILMVVFSFILVWFWQTLSGCLIWAKLANPEWGGFANNFIYSLVFNGISIWAFSYPITQILISLIIPRLQTLSWKR